MTVTINTAHPFKRDDCYEYRLILPLVVTTVQSSVCVLNSWFIASFSPPVTEHSATGGHHQPQALIGTRRNSAVEKQPKAQRATLAGGQPCLCHKATSSMDSKRHTCGTESWDTPTISLRQTGPRGQLPVRPLLRGAMQYLQTAHSRRSSPTTGALLFPGAYEEAHIHAKPHLRSGRKTTQKIQSRETAQTHHEGVMHKGDFRRDGMQGPLRKAFIIVIGLYLLLSGTASPGLSEKQLEEVGCRMRARSPAASATSQVCATVRSSQGIQPDNARQEAHPQRISQVSRGSRDRRTVACGSKDEFDRIRSSQATLTTAKTMTSNPTATTRANLGRYGHNYDEVDVLLYNLCLNIESAL
ncbi:unnamed protein product [Schistocephalus solidus]|uniref:G_PROTEIN_RECEP_F1_2 domain-containing protein n=1 Tax=Schistocephalus solidus TaxID=70667 RepID=A0A183S807_SCHSO|nr:unnamed protein product [Schistocephalus solidus]